MAEPLYLGFVRFGAGEGCGCGRSRLVTVQKVQHAWDSDSGNYTLPWAYSPKTTGLELIVAGSWFAPLSAEDIDRRGSYVIGRLTGATAGQFVMRTLDRNNVTSATDREIVIAGGLGTISLAQPYPPADLVSDLNDLWAYSSAISGAAWGGQYVVGRAEIDPHVGEGIFRFGGAPYIGGRPADGRVVVEAVTQKAPGWFGTQSDAIGIVASEFVWNSRIYRQRGQLSFQGYFARYDVLIRELQGGQIVQETGERSYFKLTRGVLDVHAPVLTEADLWSTDSKVRRETWIELNVLPPGGADKAIEVQGLLAAGGGC